VFLFGLLDLIGGVVLAVYLAKQNASTLSRVYAVLGGVAGFVQCLFVSACMFIAVDMGRNLRAIKHNTARR
jgi:hypothetical protein